MIWRAHPTGPMGAHIWAPELHRIGGKWYIYFASAPAEDVWAIRIWVLENAHASTNPAWTTTPRCGSRRWPTHGP
ncbi:hypothetical protein GCM10010345_03690 [Streptomyces canarius]|uniref:Uncharacterized protein n=1 Tax=Streptomyces canarius TaxID=285453 RepID=A0ABQ3CCM7_9ACTN|nr:hypothetical protein GCM10010345_03690 [Streptomyces canarius]